MERELGGEDLSTDGELGGIRWVLEENGDFEGFFWAICWEKKAFLGNEVGVEQMKLRAGKFCALPTIPSQRTSTEWEMASLWMSLMVSVPSFYIAGSLVEKGMTWWHGILIIIASATILLVPLLLTSHPGTRYGIPFPVFTRAAFGVGGAHVPALLCSFIGCGWLGIDTWLGGQAIYILLPAFWPHPMACNISPRSLLLRNVLAAANGRDLERDAWHHSS